MSVRASFSARFSQIARTLGIGDAFQVLDMGETQDAAVILRPAKPQRILEQAVAYRHPARSLRAPPVLRRGEQAGRQTSRLPLARRSTAPESGRETRSTPLDDLLEYPGAIGVTGVRRRLVAFLREIGEQEIADHGADVEADRADEGEFRIDDPRVGDSSP